MEILRNFEKLYEKKVSDQKVFLTLDVLINSHSDVFKSLPPFQIKVSHDYAFDDLAILLSQNVPLSETTLKEVLSPIFSSNNPFVKALDMAKQHLWHSEEIILYQEFCIDQLKDKIEMLTRYENCQNGTSDAAVTDRPGGMEGTGTKAAETNELTSELQIMRDKYAKSESYSKFYKGQVSKTQARVEALEAECRALDGALERGDEENRRLREENRRLLAERSVPVQPPPEAEPSVEQDVLSGFFTLAQSYREVWELESESQGERRVGGFSRRDQVPVVRRASLSAAVPRPPDALPPPPVPARRASQKQPSLVPKEQAKIPWSNRASVNSRRRSATPPLQQQLGRDLKYFQQRAMDDLRLKGFSRRATSCQPARAKSLSPDKRPQQSAELLEPQPSVQFEGEMEAEADLSSLSELDPLDPLLDPLESHSDQGILGLEAALREFSTYDTMRSRFDLPGDRPGGWLAGFLAQQQAEKQRAEAAQSVSPAPSTSAVRPYPAPQLMVAPKSVLETLLPEELFRSQRTFTRPCLLMEGPTYPKSGHPMSMTRDFSSLRQTWSQRPNDGEAERRLSASLDRPEHPLRIALKTASAAKSGLVQTKTFDFGHRSTNHNAAFHLPLHCAQFSKRELLSSQQELLSRSLKRSLNPAGEESRILEPTGLALHRFFDGTGGYAMPQTITRSFEWK